MKTNKAFFVVALLLSVSAGSMYAYPETTEGTTLTHIGSIKTPTTPTITPTPTTYKSTPGGTQGGSVIDTIADIVKRSVAIPVSIAGVSSYFMYKVGTDLYTNYVQTYGSYITDAAITKSVEGVVPFNYGTGMSKWALTCIVGGMAFMTARKIASSAPDIIRTPVEVVTRAVQG